MSTQHSIFNRVTAESKLETGKLQVKITQELGFRRIFETLFRTNVGIYCFYTIIFKW